MNTRTLNFSGRVDALASVAVMAAYNEGLRKEYERQADVLTPDDYAFLYTLIEEEVSEEEILGALEALRKAKRKVMFVTSRDGLVCEVCEALDGTVFDLKETEGLLPIHPNCRCFIYPVGLE